MDGKRATVLAHRWAYEHFVGPIPAGLDVDHECHNADPTCLGGSTCRHRRCVNPEHLKPKTRSGNQKASYRFSTALDRDEHGTTACHDAGCRCEPCVLAYRTYCRESSRRFRERNPGYFSKANREARGWTQV